MLSSGPESWTLGLAKCNQAGGTLAEICDGNTNANLRNVMAGTILSVGFWMILNNEVMMYMFIAQNDFKDQVITISILCADI